MATPHRKRYVIAKTVNLVVVCAILIGFSVWAAHAAENDAETAADNAAMQAQSDAGHNAAEDRRGMDEYAPDASSADGGIPDDGDGGVAPGDGGPAGDAEGMPVEEESTEGMRADDAADDAAAADAASVAASSGDAVLQDGTFTGKARGYGGPVEVSVTVEGGIIQSVDILDADHEDEAWLNNAIVLLDRIVEEQSTDIDVVSGATYTSRGILDAATEALQKSMSGDES